MVEGQSQGFLRISVEAIEPIELAALGCPGPGSGHFIRAGGSMLYQFGHGKKYQKISTMKGKTTGTGTTWYNCKTGVGMNMYEMIY